AILGGDFDGVAGHLAHGDVLNVHVLDDAAAPACRLHANSRGQIFVVAVVDEDVSHPAGHIRADREPAGAGGSADAADDDVFGRPVDAPSFFVHAALERDAVVAAGDVAIFNNHVAAGIDIDTVGVRPAGGIDAQAANDHVAAVGQMNRPERSGLSDREIFEHDVAAINRGDELRAKGKFVTAENALLGRQALEHHLVLSGPRSLLRFFPPPPRLALAEQKSAAGDGDVL